MTTDLLEVALEALKEMQWYVDSDTMKGVFTIAAIHGCGPTPETR